MGAKKIVLLSGGWESTLCAILAQPAKLIFFDYGQWYVVEELHACQKISNILNTKIDVIKISDIENKNGIFTDRNSVLIKHAAQYGEEIWFGCRAPSQMFDRYGDSNRVFANELGKKLKIKIITPCILLPKWYIKKKVSGLLTKEIVFSSEGLS